MCVALYYFDVSKIVFVLDFFYIYAFRIILPSLIFLFFFFFSLSCLIIAVSIRKS